MFFGQIWGNSHKYSLHLHKLPTTTPVTQLKLILLSYVEFLPVHLIMNIYGIHKFEKNDFAV